MLIPALTYKPLALKYATKASSIVVLHRCLYSATHFALTLFGDEADNGVPSPNTPRNANSKSPLGSLCKPRSGKSWHVSRLCRLKNGRIREINRSSRFRTNGWRTFTVPSLKVNRRGFPCPLRSPLWALSGILCLCFRRLKASVTSCSIISCSHACMMLSRIGFKTAVKLFH